jgi:hypothetical protein
MEMIDRKASAGWLPGSGPRTREMMTAVSVPRSLSCLIPSYPILSYPTYPVLSRLILSSPVLWRSPKLQSHSPKSLARGGAGRRGAHEKVVHLARSLTAISNILTCI